MNKYSVIGKAKNDIGIVKKVVGGEVYIDDISLPGMLYGRILGSKYSHARIMNIETSRAKRLPGVKAIITGKDIPATRWGIVLKDKYVFAVQEVRSIGDDVAGVVADDRETAEEACLLIHVDYEELPAVFDADRAMREDAPLVHEGLEKYERISRANPIPNSNIATYLKLRKGDVEAGFNQSDYIFEDEFFVPALHTSAMETIGCISSVDSLGNVKIWSSTQSPYQIRNAIATYLGIPFNRVRVIVPYLGGAFGGKVHVKGELACVIMSKIAGRPVKLIFTREETFANGGMRHPLTMRVKTGVNKDGRILAHQSAQVWNYGAYAGHGPRLMWRAMQSGAGPYTIHNIRVDSYGVYTNNPACGAYRGFGVNQVTWPIETHMDIIAEKLKMDPLEFRIRNALEEGEFCPTGEVAHAVGLKECIRELKKKSNWTKLKRHKRKHIGIGIACFHKSTNTPTSGAACVKLNQDGSADIITSLVDMGQGTGTVFAQIVSEELTIPFEKINVTLPDTEKTPYYSDTTGSRANFVLGSAVKRAAEDAREKLLVMASQLMGVRAEDLTLKNGKVVVKDKPDRVLRFTDMPIGGEKFSSGLGEPIIGEGTFTSAPMATTPDPETAQATRSSLFWMYGAHIAVVQVDVETGMVKVRHILAAHNVGRVMNKLMLQNQCEGGVSMAIGEALYEEFIVSQGEVINDNFCDYKIPSFMDTPDMIESIFVEVPHRDAPYGNVGVGEAVVLGASAAIGNAIYDAVGVRVKELPITAEKIVRKIKS